jgi:hypothetical protein
MKKEYIYLGQYYDVLGRELNITDKKIGFSEIPLTRQNSLNRTKSPIGYEIILLFEVDDMRKVEKMLHAILDSRRVYGEWFRDDEDTLTGEFNNFMVAYGGTPITVEELKPETTADPDNRLKELATKLGEDTMLTRTYKGVDYDVLLKKDGRLLFNGEYFDTPNKLYNNGVVKYARGYKGNSGTNNLSQFKIKETGERLID